MTIELISCNKEILNSQPSSPKILSDHPITSIVVEHLEKSSPRPITGKKILDDGTIYEGDLIDGRMTGRGKLLFPNGDTYESSFVNGRSIGQGKFIGHDGKIYEGNFTLMNGKISGQGNLTFPNGNRYEGHFLESRCSGQGKLIFADGSVYEGNFIKNQRSGLGKLTFADGEIYEGDFLDGKPTGRGTFIFSNGDIYQGDFYNNRRTGRGKITFSNGEIYEGDFLGGKPTGRGTFIFSNGDIYQGDFAAGRRTGDGKLTLSNGKRYKGIFLDGRYIDPDITTSSTENLYEGDLLDDQRTGRGKITFPNGDVYEGDLICGHRTGHGILISYQCVYEGSFLNDQFHGKGRLTFADRKSCLEGDFINGQLPEQGSLFLYSGDIYVGKFIDGQPNGGGKLITSEDTYTKASDEELRNADLSNPRFHDLLLGRDYCCSSGTFTLGILSDYLKKNFPEVAAPLLSAYQIAKCPIGSASRKIYASFINEKPQLLLYCSKDHAMGLNIVYKDNYVYFEIFNSGGGLQTYHKRNPEKKNSFQTMLQIRVPKSSVTDAFIAKFSVDLKDVKRGYESILNLEGAERVDQECPIWQTVQKGDNCSLEWIFAYLKNKMSKLEYARMRAKLFDDCSKLTTDASVKEELERKRDKRLRQIREILE